MYRWTLTACVTALSLFVLSCGDSTSPSSPDIAAGEIAINFETLPGPDGRLGTGDDIPMPGCPGAAGCLVTTLSNEFASMGVTFVNWPVFFEPRAVSAGNVQTNNHTVTYGSGAEPRPEVRLSVPVYRVSLTSFSVWSLRLDLFDTNGVSIGSTSLPHPNPGCPTSCDQVHGTVVVTSQVRIASFSLETERQSPVNHADGGQTYYAVSVDNLVLGTSPP